MKIGFNQRMMNMIQQRCYCIGSGSGRSVFELKNGYVVKVAKNKAGIAQNKSEYQISLIDYSNLFAKVIRVSDDFQFLIMEKANRLNNFSYVLRYFNVRNINELFNLNELTSIQWKYDLLRADLCRSSSWGIIKGRPVIIDYGFTREVRKRYYYNI